MLEVLEQDTMVKQCRECNEEKELDDFYRERDTLCKVCTIEYQKNWRKKKNQTTSSDDTIMRIIDKLIAERSSISSEVVFQKLEEVLDSNETILRKLKEINLSETEKSPEKFKSSKK